MAEKDPWESSYSPEKIESGSYSSDKNPWEAPTAQDIPQVDYSKMHPDVTLEERALIKNFGTDYNQAAKWLKEKHPSLEVKADPNEANQLLIKGKNERQWKVLDPKGTEASWEGLKELGRDILDVPYDIGAGIGTTAATAAAGLAAAPTGLGALPAAALAGGATSAGLETLRQAKGRELGLGDMSGKDIAISGALGAASPLVLGTGAVGASVLEKSLLSGVEQKALQASQKGLPMKAASYVGEKITPVIGETVSGIGRNIIKAAKRIGPELDKIFPDNNVLEYGKNVVQKTADKIRTYLQEGPGKDLNAILDRPDVAVDITKAREPIQKLADRFEEIYKRTPTTKNANALDAVKTVLGNFDELPEDAIKNMTPRDAWDFKNALSMTIESTKDNKTKLVNSAVSKSLKSINDILESSSGGGYKEANKAYSEGMRAQKFLDPFLKDPYGEKMTKYLSKALNDKPVMDKLAEIDRTVGSNLLEDSANLSAFRLFHEPSIMAKSGLGSTSTSRSTMLGGAGGTLGYMLGEKVAQGRGGGILGAGILGTVAGLGGGPWGIKQYIKAGQGLKNLQNLGVNREIPFLGMQSGEITVPAANAWLQMKR